MLRSKNLQLLINSVNNLVSEGNHISLIIIGDNYFTSDLGKELRDLAGDTIHFIGTRVNVSDFFI
jgi:glycosyltransferase involved in cell wall biosynthesis